MAKSSSRSDPVEGVGAETFAGFPLVRHAFTPRHRVAVFFSTPGRTKQSFKDECDVNVIMRRYERTGVLPTDGTEPQYGDATGADFQAAQLLVAEARSRFFALPARVRDRFENDPGTFLAFMEDDRNHAEAREMGLLPAEPAPPNGAATPLATPPASVAPEPPARVEVSTNPPKA